jgi:site-specific recombinase XerD
MAAVAHTLPARDDHEEALDRARAALTAAEAAGVPMLDPLGRRPSPVTMPEYRRGRRPGNAGRRFPVEILTPGEIAALLDALPNSRAGIRDAALIVLLWRAGLRIAEALALQIKDLDPAASTITVLRGKGAKRRVAVLDPVAVHYLARWLATRAELGADDQTVPLFCTTRADGPVRPMRASGFRETLKRNARRAGITRRVHPHCLRHARKAR